MVFMFIGVILFWCSLDWVLTTTLYVVFVSTIFWRDNTMRRNRGLNLTDARDARGCLVSMLSILPELLVFDIVVKLQVGHFLILLVVHEPAKKLAHALELTRGPLNNFVSAGFCPRVEFVLPRISAHRMHDIHDTPRLAI